MDSTNVEGFELVRRNTRSFLWSQRLHATQITRESNARRRSFVTLFLEQSHQSAKWSWGFGDSSCHPQHRSTLYQTSREKTHCRRVWSIYSDSWAHNAHVSVGLRKWRCSRSAVQHLPRSTSHTKKRQLLGARVFPELRCTLYSSLAIEQNVVCWTTWVVAWSLPSGRGAYRRCPGWAAPPGDGA
jgi:hypothetical protein